MNKNKKPTHKNNRLRSVKPASRTTASRSSAASTSKSGSTGKSKSSPKTNKSKSAPKAKRPKIRITTRRLASEFHIPEDSKKRKAFAIRWLKRGIIVVTTLVILILIILHHNASEIHDLLPESEYVHDNRFANYLVLDGIDVSYAQGSDIDWDKVKNSGVDFVLIRAGFRSGQEGILTEDEEFRKNITGAKKAGLMVGAYLYSQAITATEAKEEAEFLMELVAPYDIDLPLVMDYEFLSGMRLEKAYSTDLMNKKYMTRIVTTFCDTVEDGGYESMLYANYSFLEYQLNGKQLGERTNIWLAHYTQATDYPDNYTFWQCACDETVPGIPTVVDKDFWYIDPSDVYPSTDANSDERISLEKCTIELADSSSSYVGKPVEPGIHVTYKGKRLKEGRDYIVAYAGNTAPGTGYLFVWGRGDYKDMVTQSFTIKKFM